MVNNERNVGKKVMLWDFYDNYITREWEVIDGICLNLVKSIPKRIKLVGRTIDCLNIPNITSVYNKLRILNRIFLRF